MHHGTSSVWLFQTFECFTWMLSFWWLFSWTVYIFPSISWMYSRDFNFIFSIKSFGSVDLVCLAYDRNSEHCVDFSHYILQKKTSLLWTSLCISDSVSCNAVNLYTAAIISFYAIWNDSNIVLFHVYEWAQLSLLWCFYRTALICGAARLVCVQLLLRLEMRWSVYKWKGSVM